MCIRTPSIIYIYQYEDIVDLTRALLELKIT